MDPGKDHLGQNSLVGSLLLVETLPVLCSLEYRDQEAIPPLVRITETQMTMEMSSTKCGSLRVSFSLCVSKNQTVFSVVDVQSDDALRALSGTTIRATFGTHYPPFHYNAHESHDYLLEIPKRVLGSGTTSS